MSTEPDAVLAEPAVAAAVDALATRNAHHFEQMSPADRDEAVAHWRDLALTVLTAARGTMETPAGEGEEAAMENRGRAVVVLEDGIDDQVNVHVSFAPQLEDQGDGQVAGTPAQITALMLLEQLGGEQVQ